MGIGAGTLLWHFGARLIPAGSPLCEEPIVRSAINADSSVKATVFDTDCGAMAASRAHVALSAWNVDARKQGSVDVTFLRIGGDKVYVTWRTTRDLLITYPAGTEVEYLVAKDSGVKIEIEEVQ